MPLTAEGMRASLRQAFSWMRPFAENPADVQVFGTGVDAGIGTMLRPIATPLTIGGFDASVIDPLASAFREQGFLPMMAGAGGQDAAQSPQALRPGDPIGVALVSGDLEFGATGTVKSPRGRWPASPGCVTDILGQPVWASEVTIVSLIVWPAVPVRASP